MLIREAMHEYYHGISTTALTDKSDETAFELQIIRRKRLEAIATLAMSLLEDIPMGGIAWYRIHALGDVGWITQLMFFSSAL